MNSSKIIWSLLKSWGDKISYTINMQCLLSFFVRSQTQCKVSVSSPLFLYKIDDNTMELQSIHFNSLSLGRNSRVLSTFFKRGLIRPNLIQTWPSWQYMLLQQLHNCRAVPESISKQDNSTEKWSIFPNDYSHQTANLVWFSSGKL